MQPPLCRILAGPLQPPPPEFGRVWHACLLGNAKITVLKCADDLVLFAKRVESLQLGRNALHPFCKINK